jgi:heme-degrading monooxygenase HmoA
MIARVTTFQFKSDRMDEALDIFKKSIVPAAKSQKGYKGLNFFMNRKIGSAVAIAFWETEEDAIANEQSHYYQEQLVKLMHLYAKPPTRERYEVVFQD